MSFPASPAGTRAQWFFDQLAAGIPASDDELTAAVAADDPRKLLEGAADVFAGMTIRTVESPSPTELHVIVDCPNSRYWLVEFRVGESSPHVLERVDWGRALPPGVELRIAEPEDNNALVEVSRSTRIVLRGSEVVIDPGPDYFEPMRLMEQATALVATDHGRVVGVQCAANYPVLYGGEFFRMAQIMHTRILPSHARMGLWSVMNRHMQAIGRERNQTLMAAASSAATAATTDSPVPKGQHGIAYVSVENDAVHRLYAGVRPWKAQPFRVTIACAAASMAGRPAARHDAGALVEILNACHDGEELYYPYTVESLVARLERAPELYTWRDVLLGDAAVVGVWHSPEVRVRTENGMTARSRRALVLDYGFLPGAETEFEALVRAAAAVAAQRGYDHLSIFSSDPSPGAALLQSLAERVERYDIIVPFAGEPPFTLDRGVYVDQVYF